MANAVRLKALIIKGSFISGVTFLPPSSLIFHFFSLSSINRKPYKRGLSEDSDLGCCDTVEGGFGAAVGTRLSAKQSYRKGFCR